jgi:PAS domain S-box-containing protein
VSEADDARRYRLFAEHAKDALAELGLDGTILYASANHLDVVGVAAAELEGRPVAAWLHPDDREIVAAELARAIEAGAESTVSYRFRHADGRWVWLETNGRSVRGPDGAPRVVTVTRDISPRRRAEAAFREPRARLAGVLESALDGVFVYRALRDDDGRIVDYECLLANPAAARTVGQPREAIEGTHLLETEPELRGSAILERLVQVTETGRPDMREGPFQSAHVRGHFRVAIVRVGDGVAATFSDVSERVRLEKELQRAHKLEAVGRLASGIAHDFNNLLTAINGYAEVLLGRIADEDPLRDDLAEIRRAGERAAALTSRLLAFGRRPAGEPSALVEPNEVVAEMAMLLRRLLGEEVELVTRIDPKAGAVRAEVGQLEQVLLNLVLNARDALPGGGRIEIETGRAAAADDAVGGELLVLRVSDDGLGMDASVSARIFEPFFTTKEPGLGHGLGLSTVYGIVQQCGGRIEARSEPGAGTEFLVYLPRSADAAAPAAAPPPPVELRGSGRLLLVEDDASIRRLAGHVLRRQGFDVLEAADGVEALDLLSKDDAPVRLLVTDVVMPHMDGPALAAELRRRQPALPVLFFSGYHERELWSRGAPAQASTFLTKPFSPARLLHEVQRLLDA